jgi:hypothetical protein
VKIKTYPDPLYQHLIFTAERRFWRCVESEADLSASYLAKRQNASAAANLGNVGSPLVGIALTAIAFA